jgi:drug/metabolite transporter (DMT)-like permease
MTRAKTPTWTIDLSLFAVTLIWGSTFILVKQALADISTLLFLTLRFSVATLVLLLVFRKELRAPHLWPSLRGGALAGLCLFSGYTLQTFGLKYTSASNAGFITGLYMPLVPLMSALIYRKPPRFLELCGVAVAFVGLALMTLRQGLFEIGRGDLLVAACAVAYALQIVVLGRFAPTGNSAMLTVGQIGTGMLLGTATFWWAEPVHLRWTSTLWIALAVTSVLATALAFWVQTWAQKSISPTRTALISSMEPVFAWATSYVLAGEVLPPRGVLGATLILLGILLVELKPASGGDFLPKRWQAVRRFIYSGK